MRHSALLLALAALFACLIAASANAAQVAVVSERDSNRVSFISAATNEPVGSPVPVGAEPTSVAITPDGKYAYVTDAGDESVSVIEMGLRVKRATVEEVGAAPFGIAITPDGKYAYVTDRGSDRVSVISTATNGVVEKIPVGNEPTGIAISPTGKFAYVADHGENEVQVINVESMSLTGAAIKVGEGPTGIEFTPGGTAYVVDELGREVSAIKSATEPVTPIKPLVQGPRPRGISISPDASKAYVVGLGARGPIYVIDTATNMVTEEIPVEGSPEEVSFAANGKTAYVTEKEPSQVQAINVQTRIGAPIGPLGATPSGIALTPDQSPVAAFTPPTATAGEPAIFDGSDSKDADGSIATYAWSFGDGATASGQTALHTYALPGTYTAKLSAADNEGCGEEEVFTGRTAYCSGAAPATHPVVVEAPETSPPVCRRNFGVGGLTHNRRNGTARLRVRLHTAGSIFLFGKKVHAVSRKAKAAGTMVLTLHARVELNKRLKRIHRAPIRIRITFTPSSGCGYKTVHRSLTLLRARHHRH